MRKPAKDPVTSASLLLRIRDPDDSDSWHQFESVYAPVIRSYCRRRGFQSTDIDDIAQEVMTAVARSIQKFEYQSSKGKFRSWLATVTANKMRSFASRTSINKSEFAEYIDQLASSPASDSHWTELFMNQVFKAAQERVQQVVEPKTWECFKKTWIEDKPAAEVAEQMEMPIHAVYVNKSRVLKRLEHEFLMLSDDYPFEIPQ